MKKTLRNNRGETLIEVLASILVATLSVALLFTCVMASSQMERSVQKKDAAHYDALTAAEAQETSVVDGTVSIARVDSSDSVVATAAPSVDIYGGEEMFSYKRK